MTLMTSNESLNVYRFKDRSTMSGESPRAGYSFLLLPVQREPPTASARNFQVIATYVEPFKGMPMVDQA